MLEILEGFIRFSILTKLRIVVKVKWSIIKTWGVQCEVINKYTKSGRHTNGLSNRK